MARLSTSGESSREGSVNSATSDEEEAIPVSRTRTFPQGRRPALQAPPEMQRANTSLRHSPALKPRLDRLNAGKVASKSCSFMADLDSEDCTFLFLPGPRSDMDTESKPWEEPGRAEMHEELLNKLPEMQRQARARSAKHSMEAASMFRELSQGSPDTIKAVAEAGAFQVLNPLLESEDPAVVEETVMAVCHFAQHVLASKRMIEGGIMAALSVAFGKAADRQPKPHFSIQSNICAAYLRLSGGSLKTSGSAIIFAGSNLLRHMLRLARPDSGCNFEGRRDSLKLMLLLCERGDVRGKLIDYGAVRVAVEIVEAREEELYEEVGALFHAFSKMDEAGRQLCGMLPLPWKLDKSGSGNMGYSSKAALAEALKHSPGSVKAEFQATTASASLGSPSRRQSSRKGMWNIPDISENEVLHFQLAVVADEATEEESKGCRGLAAVLKLLDLNGTILTQELALSILTRLVTRGVFHMSLAVKEQPGMMEALELMRKDGGTRAKKKAHALVETLKKVTKESMLEKDSTALQEIRAKSCGSVQAY